MRYLIACIFLLSCTSMQGPMHLQKEEALANWYCNYKIQERKSKELFEDCFARMYIKFKD